MNAIYKVIYCIRTQSWKAASEFSKSRGKKSSVRGGSGSFLRPNFSLSILPLALLAALSGQQVLAEDAVCVDPNDPTIPVGTTNANADQVACGKGANASGPSSVAVGADSNASGVRSSAVGSQSQAIGSQSSAFGDDAKANADNTLAMGSISRANGEGSTAVGSGATTRVGSGAAVAVGSNSSATNEDVAIGGGALSNGSQDAQGFETDSGGQNTAVGYFSGSKLNGTGNTVIGRQAGANTTGNRNALVGHNAGGGGFGPPFAMSGNDNVGSGSGVLAAANGNNNVGLGAVAGAQVTGNNNVAIGYQAGTKAAFDNATGAPTPGAALAYNNAVNIGNKTQALSDNAIAMGTNAASNGYAGVAIGMDSSASLAGAALGLRANAQGQSSVALGPDSKAFTTESTALGLRATAQGDQSTALGNDSLAYGYSSMSNGGNRSGANGVGLQYSEPTTDGTSDPAAPSGGVVPTNLRGLIGASDYFGGQYFRRNVAAGENSQAWGTHAQALGNGSVAMGLTATTGDGTGTFGATRTDGLTSFTSTSGENAIAIGSLSWAKSDNSTAIGFESLASGESAVAIGKGAQATGNQSISIGTGNVVTGDNSGALGDPTFIDADDSYSIGNNNTIAATAGQTFILGNNVSATAANNVILGNNSGESSTTTTNGAFTQVNSATIGSTTYNGFAGTASGIVSVGKTGTERQIINVAPGEISATSTDAINGSQLFAVANELDRQNYFHTNPTNVDKSGDPTASADNLAAVDGIGGATGANSLAAGANAAASATRATAVGDSAQATAINGTAVGQAAQATGDSGSAFGYASTASGLRSTALGREAAASGEEATAAGYNAQATGENATAYGAASEATAEQTTALGEQSKATAKNATATGNGAEASGLNSSALGTGSIATGENATATGYDARATATSASAFGTGAYATAVGATASGRSSRATGDDSSAYGTGAVASGKQSIAVGRATNATAENATAVGSRATAVAESATAVGYHADARADSASAFGRDADAKAESSIAVGRNSTAEARQSTAIGAYAQAYEADSVALGAAAEAFKANSTAIGSFADAKEVNSTALGSNASANLADSVALGSGSVADRAAGSDGYNPITGLVDTADAGITATKSTLAAVSIGSAGNTRQIINVAAGTNDSDAVNVAQLKALRSGLIGYNAGLGGFALKAQDGTEVTQSLGKSIEIVGGATTAGTYTSNNVRTVVNGGKIEIQMAESPKFGNVTINDGGTGKITGVTAGAINATSTEAVNGSQIHNIADQNATNVFGGNATVNADGSTSFTDIGGTGANTIHDAIQSINTTASAGFTIAGASATTATDAKIVPTDTLNIVGAAANTDFSQSDAGKNIYTVVDANNTVRIGLANDLDVTSVKAQTVNATTSVTIGDASDPANSTTLTSGANGLDVGGDKITNVAAGDISATSTDAVNGSQIHNIASQNATNVFGGNATVNADGSTSFTNVGGTGADNIHDAIQSISTTAGKYSTVEAGSNIVVTPTTTNGQTNYVVSTSQNMSLESVQVSQGLSVANGATVDMGNNRIQNVAAGVNPSDAVNYAQLMSAYSYTNQLAAEANAGVASAIATANLPQPHDPGASMFSIGAGHHGNQQAIAIGLSAISDNGRWVLKGSLSTDTKSNVSAGVGVGYQW